MNESSNDIVRSGPGHLVDIILDGHTVCRCQGGIAPCLVSLGICPNSNGCMCQVSH